MVRTTTKDAKTVEDQLTTHSQAGRDAIHKHFNQGVRAIKDAMREGRIATGDGASAIADLVRKRLNMFGVTGPDAEKIINASVHGGKGGLRRGGLAAMVPGASAGDNHTLSIDGVPKAQGRGRRGESSSATRR